MDGGLESQGSHRVLLWSKCGWVRSAKTQLGSFGENGRRCGSTRWSCTVPCKEQARNRGPSPVVVFCSRRLTDQDVVRPSVGPRDASVAGCPSRGRPD
jgi:hypothetical protein